MFVAHWELEYQESAPRRPPMNTLVRTLVNVLARPLAAPGNLEAGRIGARH